jgi:transcription termination factor Rho
MSVLDRTALEQSPLADLHEIASELSIDGFRRLRRPQLIQAILDKQEGLEQPAGAGAEETDDEPAAAAAAATGTGETDGEPAATDAEETDGEPGAADDGNASDDAVDERASGRKPTPHDADTASVDAPDGAEADPEADEEDRPAPRRRRGRRGGRGRSTAREESSRDDDDEDSVEAVEAADEVAPAAEQVFRPSEETSRPGEDETVEGAVELLPNGSGFVRVDPPEPSDGDVYISAAQVKRCELVSGDRISGPKRAARRSERFASLIRIDTINGRPAAELADSVRFDDLPAGFPDDRFRLGSEDPTVKAIEWLTPFGKGSRVVIAGAARSGKTEALRRLGAALVGHDELTLTLVLAGVRPEEISEASRGSLAPAVGMSFAVSPDAQGITVEPVIDQARRLAARGSDAVVLIDTLDGLHPQTARRLLAAARNIIGGGSVTVIATASAPLGGETTVIALDASLASTARFPALDLTLSGTLRPELLVGEAGAEAIARTRAEALGE